MCATLFLVKKTRAFDITRHFLDIFLAKERRLRVVFFYLLNSCLKKTGVRDVRVALLFMKKSARRFQKSPPPGQNSVTTILRAPIDKKIGFAPPIF